MGDRKTLAQQYMHNRDLGAGHRAAINLLFIPPEETRRLISAQTPLERFAFALYANVSVANAKAPIFSRNSLQVGDLKLEIHGTKVDLYQKSEGRRNGEKIAVDDSIQMAQILLVAQAYTTLIDSNRKHPRLAKNLSNALQAINPSLVPTPPTPDSVRVTAQGIQWTSNTGEGGQQAIIAHEYVRPSQRALHFVPRNVVLFYINGKYFALNKEGGIAQADGYTAVRSDISDLVTANEAINQIKSQATNPSVSFIKSSVQNALLGYIQERAQPNPTRK